MTHGRAALAAALAVGSCAPLSCAHLSAVERAYGGHVVDGGAVEPQAYAAFLRATMAEADGDLRGALAAYRQASHIDPDAAEIWARIADVTCRADPRDPRADTGFARALDLDPTLAHTLALQSRCLLARGDLAGARTAASRAVELDPSADGANVLLARTRAPGEDAETRAVLVGLTVTARDPLVAWDALSSWAQSRGDVVLWARALRETVRMAPGRRDDVARAAEELAGVGQTREARDVAAAAADADESPLRSDHALAARLAVDEAIARGDAGAVELRATRVRMSLEEAAARALLAGEPGRSRALARELASALALADPRSAGAHLVLAATGLPSPGPASPGFASTRLAATGLAAMGDDVVGAAYDVRALGGAAASAAAFVAFGVVLLRATSPERARATLAQIAHLPLVAGDDRVVRPAVDLASRGGLAAEALPPDGLVELAARRAEPPPEALMAPDAHALDARHEYLALALAHPDGPRAAALAARLDDSAASDPVVASASALMLVAAGGARAAGAARALLARDAGDPLLVATALRVAERAGDRDVARRARDVLTALGGGIVPAL